MERGLTTGNLRDLLLTLKKHFTDENGANHIDLETIDIYASVVSVNYKSREVEHIRISEELLALNLPIPLKSVLEVHIETPSECRRYLDEIMRGLPEEDYVLEEKEDRSHITLQNIRAGV